MSAPLSRASSSTSPFNPSTIPHKKYNPKSTKEVRSFIEHLYKVSPDRILHFEGHKYYIDHDDGSIILLPGGEIEKAESWALHSPNRPDERFKGNDLELAAREFMIGSKAFFHKQEKRERKGKLPLTSFTINLSGKYMRGYVSGYKQDKKTGDYHYVTRCAEYGIEIQEKNHKIFKRIEELREAKWEKEKAFKKSKGDD